MFAFYKQECLSFLRIALKNVSIPSSLTVLPALVFFLQLNLPMCYRVEVYL